MSDASYTKLIGISQNIRKARELIEKIADAGLNALITGETGTGKELVARSLYQNSERNKNPFVKVNCAALPDSLMESELFGYEAGAFTGANKKLKGKFQLANKGILFLDEIGDMSHHLQSKLLRVLQDGNFSPLGSEKDVTSDVWIISATNKNLQQEIQNKKFRMDLFFRLNTINIHLSSLRERREDIPILMDYYWKKYRDQFGKNKYLTDEIPSKLMAKLVGYHWPGNVRELQNILKRLSVLGFKDEIVDNLFSEQDAADKREAFNNIDSMPDELKDNMLTALIDDRENKFALKEIGKAAVKKAERQIILHVLGKTRWNRKKATEILDVSYPALLYKMKELNIYPN